MSQQPNIQTESKKNIKDSELPVPRSQGKDIPLNPLRSPDEEVFSIPSPDSGYALKLIKPFTPMWKDNHKHKLITKVVTNLVWKVLKGYTSLNYLMLINKKKINSFTIV